MTKFSVTQNGVQLDTSLYTWDEKSKTFSTNENYLILDFSNIDHVTFKTGSWCIFKTGSDCTFKTGYSCTFKTGSCCTFDTGSSCTFDTASDCTFDTASDCTFDTGPHCIFKAGSNGTFNTGYSCAFKTACDCTFKTGSKCVIVRRDVFEVIQLLEEENHIKLNGSGIKGYIVLKSHTIIVDGKEVELSSEGYEQVKNLLK